MANILIVDDDELILRTVAAALKKAGHLVTAAKDGYQAIDVAQRELFDLIISDVNMGAGVSGYNLVATLKKSERYKTTPIMLLTGRREKKDVLRGMDSGADDYLVKPIDFDMLLAKVESLLKSTKHEYSFTGTPISSVAVWPAQFQIRTVSEQGFAITSIVALPVNSKIKIECPLYKEIGIESADLRVAACSPMNGDAPLFSIRLHFIGLTESDFQKIRLWVRSRSRLSA